MHLNLFFLFLLGAALGEQVASPRSTRTLGSFFGYGGQQQVQQQQVVGRDDVKPLVYQVRYYDGKVGQGQVQGQEKVGVGAVDGVQQGKVQQHQYYQVAPVGPPVVGSVPGSYVYVQVPYTPYGQQQQQQGQGQQGQGPQQAPFPFVGQYGVQQYQVPVPCPIEYVYYYDTTKQQQGQQVQRPVPVSPVVQPGVVQPNSPVTYTNRVRPPQFQQQSQQQQQVSGQGQHQQQQVPGVGVVPVPVPSVYDYYYNQQQQHQHQQQPYGYPYYSGVGGAGGVPAYYPHYYNPVVSPSSDFFYIYQKPVVGDKGQGQVVQGQAVGQQSQQVVTPTEGTKKE